MLRPYTYRAKDLQAKSPKFLPECFALTHIGQRIYQQKAQNFYPNASPLHISGKGFISKKPKIFTRMLRPYTYRAKDLQAKTQKFLPECFLRPSTYSVFQINIVGAKHGRQ
jgi:hypothetical protein